MTIKGWLAQAEAKLKLADIGTARLDVLILLEDETGKDRSWLLAHPETVLQGPSLKRLDKKIKRRAKHEPLAYIRGFTEFYGRKFKVNKHVLEPRPESETMVELLLDLVDSRQQAVDSSLQIVDVGTGSGALAITTKLEISEAEVIATDIDPNCLAVAHQNAKDHGFKIKFLQGNLFVPLYSLLTTPYTLICNLPYVPDKWRINKAAAREPKKAIFGGPDGLDIYRRLFEQLSKTPQKADFILTESLPPQHEKLVKIAKSTGYKLKQNSDLVQLFELL